jgi:putative flippase GtrA
MPTTGSPVRASTDCEPNLHGPSSGSRSGSLAKLAALMTTSPSQLASLRAHVRSSWRILLKEVTAFGLIGAMSLIIDLGLYNLLASNGWLKAKLVSTVVATMFAYFGNRHLSFSHRARTTLGRETSYFFGINLVTLIFSELILGLFAYPLNQRGDHVVMNIVNLLTIGIGTVFRFWAYKRFVFLHPDKVHSPDVDLEVELAE